MRRVASTGGRMLLYRVGGGQFASPLDSLREIVDMPEDAGVPGGKSPNVHGHRVRLASLNRILGLPEVREVGTGGLRSMLVVEVESQWIGMLVDSVQGIHIAKRVAPVPENVTGLPSGVLIGAFALAGYSPPAGAASEYAEGETINVDAGELETSGTARESGGETATAQNIVVVLDLAPLGEAELAATDSDVSLQGSEV